MERGRAAQRDIRATAHEHRDEARRPQGIGQAGLGLQQQALAADALALPARRIDARQPRHGTQQTRFVIGPGLAIAPGVQA